MSFLNGIFLVALPIAAAPILLHLLRRRRRQVVAWGAMQFLTDAVAKGRRFDRIEEWVLLALRTTVLIALVLRSRGRSSTDLRRRPPWSRRCLSLSTIRCRPTASRQAATSTKRFATGPMSLLRSAVRGRECA